MLTSMWGMISDFLADPTRTELTFDPDLDKKDRALIHVLAQKHNLGHKSEQGRRAFHHGQEAPRRERRRRRGGAGAAR